MFRTLMQYLIFLSLLLCLILVLLGYVSRHQDPIGLIDGKLMNCPERPICVSSRQNQDHPSWIQPLTFQDAPAQAWERAQACVQNQGGKIQKVNDRYLWATFHSSIFGFVDDLELRLYPGGKTIQVRSASRLASYDLGQNRRRVEKLRTCFQGANANQNKAAGSE